MTGRIRFQGVMIAVVAAVAAFVGSAAIGQTAQDHKKKSGAAPELPAGWSEADMAACTEAGTPGKMHALLAEQVGVWQGATKMWMGPDAAEPQEGTCTWTVRAIMDGRYIQCEMSGEMPGMGTFSGLGTTGFDNVSQKFVGSWVDNHSTGIMHGTGALSKDGKKIAWTYDYNCPITKKPAVTRQVDELPSGDAMSFEMFVTDPKSGKEYRCMHVDLTRKR